MHRHHPHSLSHGFTLIEMAITLFIVALLLGGLLVPLGTQVEQRKINETQKTLEEIKDALLGFAITTGRLPCPASPVIATGLAGAGEEDCSIAAGTGVIPWVNLGVSETDAWGRRFSYRVTMTFADNTDGTGCGTAHAGVSFELCSVGSLKVLATTGGANVALNLPTIIISHGKNGYGGYTTQGKKMAITSASADEKENADEDTNTSYVSHTYTDDFDDIVTWLSPNILFNRMVAAGKLP